MSGPRLQLPTILLEVESMATSASVAEPAPSSSTLAAAPGTSAAAATAAALDEDELEAFSIKADGESLQQHLSEIRQSVHESREKLRLTINLPVSGIGRAIDIFEKVPMCRNHARAQWPRLRHTNKCSASRITQPTRSLPHPSLSFPPV